MTAQRGQRSLFDGVFPYGGRVPAAKSETSREAAAAITAKVGGWQKLVLNVLLEHGALSDEQIEVILQCEHTRTSRPRRRELQLAGFVEDSGKRVLGIGGTHVTLWQLTESGVQLANAVPQ